MTTGILRACLAASCLVLISADWNAHEFLQNTLEEQPEGEEGAEGEGQAPLAEAWVPGDFADEISRLKIPGRGRLPARIRDHEEEEEEEEEEERERESEREEEEEGEDEEEDKESDESDDRDYHSYEGTKGNKRPYVVNYEVTETIPFDTKRPRPKGPVYPLPPPCPGAPPPTFPPPPPPSSTKAPPAKDFYFPPGYDSYFPTSYMSQSHTAPRGTLVLPWTRLPAAFYTHLPGPSKLQEPGGGYYPEVKPFSTYFPEAKQLQQSFVPDPHLQPLFSPQTNHQKIVPAPARFPRRASPQPQRVIVRYHRPAYVIRKIQQIGPGADALIIRQPTPKVKEVHIHHHHDPGPVIHVHKDDDSDFLEDAKFEAALAGQKAQSEAELVAAGHFAEPAKKKKSNISRK